MLVHQANPECAWLHVWCQIQKHDRCRFDQSLARRILDAVFGFSPLMASRLGVSMARVCKRLYSSETHGEDGGVPQFALPRRAHGDCQVVQCAERYWLHS